MSDQVKANKKNEKLIHSLVRYFNEMANLAALSDFFKANKPSFWIKLVAQWCSMAIYLFSLLAPIVFPNRDFS